MDRYLPRTVDDDLDELLPTLPAIAPGRSEGSRQDGDGTTSGPGAIVRASLRSVAVVMKHALQEKLRHVYWIGGGSGAGKSTIARRIATEHGLRVYATDDVMADHARRSTMEGSPLLHRFLAMDMDERWVNRPPTTMLETFHWFQGEGFNLVLDDLRCLPREPGVLVEGFRLLPRLVAPLLSVPAHAVWLLPTPAFREAVIEKRGGSSSGFLARTTDPERALRNLLKRDQMFTDALREEAARLGLSVITVDAATPEDDLVRRVTEVFEQT
jgi:2-phosphoglycerate kinase